MSAPSTSDDEALAPGNPVRFRSLPVVLGGVLTAVVAMASPVSASTMLLVGGLGALAAAFGTLDLLGTFDDEAVWTAPARALLGPGAVVLGALLFGLWATRAAVAGTVRPSVAAFTIPGALVAALAGGFRFLERLGPLALDERGCLRPLHRRHGFWLLALAILIHVPLLGSHSLIDPWESHYGEVSREILARGDWISLWWAEDGWFQSKPILTFWLQAAFMAATGVAHEPGRMLSAVALSHTPHPEWALRLPSFLSLLVGLYALYRGVARTAGRRAAFLGGVALITMPQLFFIARQAMTDMPFVAGMMGATGCVLLAAHHAPEARVRAYELPFGRLSVRVSLMHVVFGVVLTAVFLQVCYLVAQNVSIATEPYFDIRLVSDSFGEGSPGNCGTPGNVRCRDGLVPAQPRVQPALQGLIWLQATALCLWLSWGERRVKRLAYLGAWTFIALACMSKGIGGAALPVAAALLWVMATGRYRELSRMEIVGGLLVFSVVAMPWFVAAYVRHGPVFIERLFFDHMVRRTFGEMHQTNKGDDTSFRYYVWQLGYATFPWSGLAPVGLVTWLAHPRRGARWSAACLFACSFAVGFVLFSMMGTKFHHYSLPLLPPLAMLLGISLDDMLRGAARECDGVAWEGALVAAAVATAAVGVDLAYGAPERPSAVRLLHLFTYQYTRPWPEHVRFDGALWAFAAVATLVVLLGVWRRRRGLWVGSLAAVAVAFALWTVDVYLMEVAPHWGQRELCVRYEEERRLVPGQLIAYQMNWKGENFYRGNAVPAFKTTGGPFQRFVDDQKRKGERAFYFLTEHKRVAALHAELGGPRDFEQLTDDRLNNKFVLVRARF